MLFFDILRKKSIWPSHFRENSFSTHVVTGSVPCGGLTCFEFASQIKFISNPSNKKQLSSSCSEGIQLPCDTVKYA